MAATPKLISKMAKSKESMDKMVTSRHRTLVSSLVDTPLVSVQVAGVYKFSSSVASDVCLVILFNLVYI